MDSAVTAPGVGHLDCVVAKVRQSQIPQEHAAVGVRIGAHATSASRGKVGQFGPQPAAVVEQFGGPVTLHPLFEDAHVGRVLVHLAHRHLVRAPVALGALAVDLFRARPALGGAEHDHRPARAFRETVATRVGLDALDLGDDLVERGCHELVHLFRLVPLDEIGRVPISAKKLVQLLMADPSQDAGIGDLVAVQVEDRQNHPIGCRVQEFVGMPTCRQRPGLGFAVADHAGHDQIGIVEGGTICVREAVAEFAAFMDRTRSLRRDVAWNAAGERELGEEALHALFVAGDVGIHLAVGAFEISVCDQTRPAMAWAGDIDHVQVVLFDHPIQMDVNEIQAWRCSPVTQEPRLDVLLAQRLLEQWIVVEIDLADREVVGGPPVRVQQCLLFVRQRVCHHCLLIRRLHCAYGRRNRRVCQLLRQ